MTRRRPPHVYLTRSTRAALIVPLFVAPLLLAGRAAAQIDAPGRSQLTYDPKTQEWVALPPADPGTDQGDLQAARQMLAERKYVAARKAFRDWFAAYPDSDLRPEALFHAADTEVYAANEQKPNDVWKAHEWYEEILNGYPGSEWAERALRRELVVAEMFLFKNAKRRIWRGTFRVSARDEALDILDRIINERAPGTPLAEQALLMQANYHFDRGEFEEAERAYARLSNDYPRSRHVRLAMQRSADAAFASFAGVEFDDAPLLEAEERYRQFAEQYPRPAEEAGVPATLERIRNSRAEKEYSIAEYYARARKPSAAAFYYRSVKDNWPDTLWAEKALARLESLPLPAEPPPVEPPKEPAPVTPKPAEREPSPPPQRPPE